MTNQPKPSQRREDRKVQKLAERIEQKLALRAKVAREQDQARPSKN